jgi:hypothetical protein
MFRYAKVSSPAVTGVWIIPLAISSYSTALFALLEMTHMPSWEDLSLLILLPMEWFLKHPVSTNWSYGSHTVSGRLASLQAVALYVEALTCEVLTQALGIDFIAASGHKMAGPSGVGFLWAKASILESMPPFQYGGEMIDQVFLDHSTFAPPPLRFEPGTPAIEQVVGLGAAVDYLESIGGIQRVHQFEKDLGEHLYEELSKVDGVKIYGPPPDVPLGRAALAAFNIDGLHATDVSMLLDAAGMACLVFPICFLPPSQACALQTCSMLSDN